MSARWIEPQDWPALALEEVHVWTAYLPSLHACRSGLLELLVPEEHARAAQFRFETHREQWQVTHGLLRFLLGRYLARRPRDVAFALNKHGKPRVPDSDLQFNASHSGDRAAFAFTRAGAVGVDIERIRADVTRRNEIARKYFAPAERDQLASAAEPERVFFDLWTCKEAFVKARGDGIFSGLDQFEVWLKDPRVLSVRGQPATGWWLARLPEMAGYSGAVVVKVNRCSPRFWKCTEGSISIR
jgi:4'-phosphopantetheinyl transferase